MAVEDLIYTIPQELAGKIGVLINILQAVGIFVIAYILFNIVNTIINKKRNKKIDEVLFYLRDIKKLLKNKK